MFRAYFVTCPGKKTREIAKGENQKLCEENLIKSNFWHYIVYLKNQGIIDFSEYVFITSPKGEVVLSSQKDAVPV